MLSFPPRLAHEQVGQARVAVHHKLTIPLKTKRIRVGRDVHRLGPFLVVEIETPVPRFLLNGVGQHIHHPLSAELLNHLGSRPVTQSLAIVVLVNSLLDGLLAGDVSPM